MKKMKTTKSLPAGRQGFTLIELLVVIAIIGLLATIVLASLNSARTKSADATVKANLANMLAQAEIYYDTNGNYGMGKSCTATSPFTTISGTGVFLDLIIQAQLVKAADSINASFSTAKVICNTSADGQSWAVMVGPMKSDSTKGWCIDNLGHNYQVLQANTPALGVCPVTG